MKMKLVKYTVSTKNASKTSHVPWWTERHQYKVIQSDFTFFRLHNVGGNVDFHEKNEKYALEISFSQWQFVIFLLIKWNHSIAKTNVPVFKHQNSPRMLLFLDKSCSLMNACTTYCRPNHGYMWNLYNVFSCLVLLFCIFSSSYRNFSSSLSLIYMWYFHQMRVILERDERNDGIRKEDKARGRL